MTHCARITPLVAALCLFVAAATAEAGEELRVEYVNIHNSSGIEDGKSWATGYTRILDVFDNGVASDEVWVAAGTYHEYNLPRIAMYGGFAGTETSRDQRDWVANPTIIDGSIGAETETGIWNVIDTQFIDGFTIRGANGVGIQSTSVGCVVRNCIIENNATRGVNLGGDGAVLQNCIIRNNSVVGVSAGRDSLIEDCVFDGNPLRLGGSPYGQLGVVRRCVFRDSDSVGLESGGVAFVVENCLFVDNNVAIKCYGIRDAEDFIYPSSVLWIFNCTFAGNATAIEHKNMYGIRIQNCIFARSNETFFSGYSYGLLNYTNLFEGGLDYPPANAPDYQAYAEDNITTGTPRFVAPVLGDFRLRPTSPAIDAGVDGYAFSPVGEDYTITYPTDDLDQTSRPLGAHYDLGAYEFDPDAPFTDPYDPSGDGQTNAIDIQRVINAILDNGDADINGDDNTDATDIQLIINAALGIG